MTAGGSVPRGGKRRVRRRGQPGVGHQRTKPVMCRRAAEPPRVVKQGMGRACSLTMGEEKFRDLILTE